MGVDVTAMTYFEGDYEYAMQQLSCPLEVQAVSYYSDQGYYVGFETSPSSYKDFDGLIAKFKEITGDDASVETFEQWH